MSDKTTVRRGFGPGYFFCGCHGGDTFEIYPLAEIPVEVLDGISCYICPLHLQPLYGWRSTPKVAMKKSDGSIVYVTDWSKAGSGLKCHLHLNRAAIDLRLMENAL